MTRGSQGSSRGLSQVRRGFQSPGEFRQGIQVSRVGLRKELQGSQWLLGEGSWKAQVGHTGSGERFRWVLRSKKRAQEDPMKDSGQPR